MRRALRLRKVEPIVAGFVVSAIKFFCWMIALLQVLSALQIQQFSATAVLTALAFAIGIALGDWAQNVLAFLVLRTYKPFDLGHYCEFAGTSGTVKEMVSAACGARATRVDRR